MPYIEIIEPELASGELHDIYEGLIRSRGKIAEVHKIQSLNPKSITSHMDLYMTIMFGQSPLKRVIREMLGVIVSVSNQCRYCVVHHAEAVGSFWKDELRLEQLIEDYSKADLDDKEKVLCDYAKELTLHPENAREEGLIRPLKQAGLSDREILDATLVISYFNFVNRIVLSLGVELEKDPGGYKYE